MEKKDIKITAEKLEELERQTKDKFTKKLIKEVNAEVTFTEINIKGPDALTRIFTTIHLGDLISYYLAMIYATDPTPVEIIERLKKEMGPFIN